MKFEIYLDNVGFYRFRLKAGISVIYYTLSAVSPVYF